MSGAVRKNARMNRKGRTAARWGALWLAAALLAAPGCTYFDDHWPSFPGTPFTPEQPEGKVTLTTLQADTIGAASEGCSPGGTVFWGTVTNTGDMNVADVVITLTPFNAAGAALGSFSGLVYNGTIDDTDPDNPVFGTTLEVLQSGSFKVCASIPVGAVARTEYRTTFTIIDEVQ